MFICHLPVFSRINPATMVADLQALLADNRIKLARLLLEKTWTDWGLMEQLYDLTDRVQRFWSPIQHLYAVKQTAELRSAYQACLPLLSAYATELGQNKLLYQAIKGLANLHCTWDYAQEKCLYNELRDFHLSGVDLPDADQTSYKVIQARLTQLSSQFEENVLDATASWFKLIDDKAALSGLPDYCIASAKKAADARNVKGYWLSLDSPSYYPVLTHASCRTLRETLYRAYVVRASELGQDMTQDNGPVLLEILNLRHAASQLLGFKNFAQKSLASNKMATSCEAVIVFLEELLVKTRGKAKQELEELTEFAYACDKLETLQPWDVLYYQEKLREKKFGVTEDAVRCYFPLEKVLSGLFALIGRLFGVQVEESHEVDIWDPQVRYFVIRDEQQQLRGTFYLDLYTRPEKREGAWMDDYQSRRRLVDGSIQLPVAFLTCNFSPPIDKLNTVLLTHEEVLTLFHEFGHGLHHLLTQIDYEGVAGINGVAWDAVEIPSQFFEYFAWEKSVLTLISGHYQTGESLPEVLIDQMHAARNFQAGLQLLRQLELALFDFQLHCQFDPKRGYVQIQAILDQVRKQIGVAPMVNFNRFQHSFSHVFAGGYAAGYYSYLWAEVLACDAFYRFLEEGLFDRSVGQAFLKHMLEQGGAVDAVELFKRFRGRAPILSPFLDSLGIEAMRTNSDGF